MNGVDSTNKTSVDVTERQPYDSMNDEELYKQYTPSVWNNRGMTSHEVTMAHVVAATKGSDEAKKNAPFALDIAYGQGEKTRLDILVPDSLPKDCPILVFIHGGYWQLMGRELSTYPALPVYNAGGGFVSVGYDLCPSGVCGSKVVNKLTHYTLSMKEIVDELKSAVEYIMHLATRRGSRGVYLCGHSAGAQLAAMMLAVDWMNTALVSPGLLKGVVLMSGVFDVRPLVRTPENDALQLSLEEAWEVSPLKHIDTIVTNSKQRIVHIYVGASDSPEFQRQAQQFHELLDNKGVCTKLLTVPEVDHFTAVERLVQPDYVVTRNILTLMELQQAPP